MDIKSYLPVIVRYAIATLASALATHGLLSPDQNTIISNNTDALVGALIAIGTVVYALWKRPSSKALEVAKKVDAEIPKTKDVVIKASAPSKPDIVVSGQ